MVLAGSNPTYNSYNWNPGRLGICQVERDGLAASRFPSHLTGGFGISTAIDGILLAPLSLICSQLMLLVFTSVNLRLPGMPSLMIGLDCNLGVIRQTAVLCR